MLELQSLHNKIPSVHESKSELLGIGMSCFFAYSHIKLLLSATSNLNMAFIANLYNKRNDASAAEENSERLKKDLYLASKQADELSRVIALRDVELHQIETQNRKNLLSITEESNKSQEDMKTEIKKMMQNEENQISKYSGKLI